MVSPTVDRRFGLVGNEALKAPVAAVATTNITLSGQQTIDGVALLAVNASGVPDRVLVTGQTVASQNGIYDVSLNAWSRSVDANGPYDLATGTQVLVGGGTQNVRTVWCLTTPAPVTIGTSSLTWALAIGSSLGNFLQAGTGAVARTFTSKARDIFSVSDFGAVCDGVTDDAAAIQKAIDALDAAAGGVIVFPGLCGVGSAGLNITSKNNLTLLGMGSRGGIKVLAASTTSLQGAGAVGVTVIRFGSCTRSGVRNFYFDGNAKVSNGIGFNQCTEHFVDGSYITSTGIQFCVGSTQANTRGRFVNNRIVTALGSAGGIWNGGSGSPSETDTVISGNQINGAGADAIIGAFIRCAIYGNTCESGGATGIGLGGGSAQTSVSGNVCRSNAFHGIQFDAIAGTNSVDGCSVVGNVCELNANDGINLSNGYDCTVSGNVCRNNSLSGIALGLAKRIAVAGNVCYDTRVAGARTQANGINIQAQTSALEVEDLQITGNICRNHTGDGIIVTASGSGTARGVSMVGNTAANNSARGISVYTTGVTNVLMANNIGRGNATDMRCDTPNATLGLNSYDTEAGLEYFSFTNADTTPTVAGGRRTFRAANTGATTISNFTNGVNGQEIEVFFSNGNTTIQHGAGIQLTGAANVTPTTNSFMRFKRMDGTWIESLRNIK